MHRNGPFTAPQPPGPVGEDPPGNQSESVPSPGTGASGGRPAPARVAGRPFQLPGAFRTKQPAAPARRKGFAWGALFLGFLVGAAVLVAAIYATAPDVLGL